MYKRKLTAFLRVLILTTVIISMILSLTSCELSVLTKLGMPALHNDKDSERLPSVPEDLTEHVFLKGRDMGPCLKLCGKAAFLCVFVTDGESTWTEDEMAAAKLEFENAASFISAEAERYGSAVEIAIAYAEGRAENIDTQSSIDTMLEKAGFGNEDMAREKMMKDAQAENGVIVLCYNSDERSFAEIGFSKMSNERMILYDCDCFTFVHEALHLFGAMDLYYPDNVEKSAMNILGDSIMREDVETVDELTAYLVGWTDQISDASLRFLRETSFLTFDMLNTAYTEETYTGYVENREIANFLYTGYVKTGIPDGKGKMFFENGDVYEGDFVFGKEHGYGVFTWADGDVYEGNFKDGKFDGHGYMTWAGGDTYEGDFVDGVRTGKGKITFANGDIYEGDFVDGVMSGYGTFSWISGDVYKGSFVDGHTDKGTLTYLNGDVYEGTLVDGAMSGYGTYRWTNGNVYEGYFENNAMNGTGTFTYSYGTSFTGTWKNGKYVG